MFALASLAGAGLRRLAALVLVLHAAGFAAPLAHAVAEAGHGHAAASAQGVEASCDPGCTNPAHSHDLHDAATCATCRALAGVAVAPPSAVIAGAAELRACAGPAHVVAVRAGCRLLPSTRGPPSLPAG